MELDFLDLDIFKIAFYDNDDMINLQNVLL